MRNYYEILGVQPDASPEEIKRAFKELARRDHPDKNSGSKASEEAFKELANAYAVLSDPNARVLYDVYGAASLVEDESGDPAAAWRRQVPSTHTLEQAAAPLYLTRAEMNAGCAKVLPVPCPACAGRGRGIGQPCHSCDGRGWSATGPTVRIEVPPGVGAGHTLWGEVIGDTALDPVLFAVRLRREGRPRSALAEEVSRQAAPLRAGRGHEFGAAMQAGDAAAERARPASFHRWPEANAFGGRTGALEPRRRLRAAADHLAAGIAASLRAQARAPSYPLAVQFAAVASALEGIGERQVQHLGHLEHRLATDVTQLRELLRQEPPPAPSLTRVEERVIQRDAGLRMTAFSLAGALILGVATAWLIEAAIGDMSRTAPLLPGPLAAFRRGWLVGVTIVVLALSAGIARRLLTDLESEDFAGLLVENVPTLMFLLLAGIAGTIFWHAAPDWLQRFGVVTTSTGLADLLPRYGVTGAGALLVVQLYALGDWLALGAAKLAAARARLRVDVLLAQRERALERARALARNVREEVQEACAGVDGLTRDLRQDFERAAGIEAARSVAADVGDAVQGLVAGVPITPAALPPRSAPEAWLHFALDLLVFALWATAVTLAAASLTPNLATLPGTGSPALAFLAALALPLAASLAGLLLKEGFGRASRAALTHRAVPWLGRRATVFAVAAVAAAFVLVAAWVATLTAAPGSAALAATWSGGTVLAAVFAGTRLDAALLAAGRCLLLSFLAMVWSGLRVADACAGAAAALFHDRTVDQPPLSLHRRHEERGESA